MSFLQSVEVVTPQVASLYLKCNNGNRKIRENHVRILAGAIRRGEWKLTHQGIAFSESGRLLDGQHRLSAIVEADTPVQLVVVRGLPDDAFMALDIGNRRTTADILALDQKLIEVANLCGFLHTSANRVTPAEASRWIDALSKAHEELVSGCKSTTRFMTCAGMRLAAILSIHDGQPAEYVHAMYRALALMDMDSLPPIGRSLVAQIASGGVEGGRGSGRATSLDALARGMVVFDPSKSDLRRVLVRERATSVAWARAVLARLLEKQGA